MAVVPLVVGRTVVTTEEAFQHAGARDGECMPIRGFDETQLSAGEPGESNLSYDLRVGAEYKDHRYGWKGSIFENDHITLVPGSAVIIETEESLHLPAQMFTSSLGYTGSSKVFPIRFRKLILDTTGTS